jgi:colicin import membrane protein
VIQDNHNVIPISLATLLHVVVFGSLIFAIDFSDRTVPVIPLAIQATLVTDNAVVIPPKVEEPPPPQPEPDTSEQDRIRAEEQKRSEDARIEQERLNRIKKAEEEAAAERQRLAEAEQRRKDEEARKERERQETEARKERERQEAEARRLAEIERQRKENERLRAEAEAARRAELDAESTRLEAMEVNAKAAYMYAIQSRVMNRWVRPASATVGTECVANITQAPGGEVLTVRIGQCNGDAAVRQSIEAAIYRASPLPKPDDPSVFEREIRLTFRPEEN